MRAETN